MTKKNSTNENKQDWQGVMKLSFKALVQDPEDQFENEKKALPAYQVDVAPVDVKAECWFCKGEDGDLLFDGEFDTFVHVKCIEQALEDDPHHPEARHMMYLLED